MEKCLICKSTLNKFYRDILNDSLIFDCPRCGYFRLSQELEVTINPNDEGDWRWILSYWIRNHQLQDKPVFISLKQFESIPLETKLPSLHEQADNLILFLGLILKHHSSKIETLSRYLASIIGAKLYPDVDYISKHLFDNGLIVYDERRGAVDDGPKRLYGLTFNGWERYHEILSKGSHGNLAFLAMEYSEEMFEKYKTYFKPAVEKTGFELRILKDVLQAGLIDDQLRVEIRKSKLLIADLSHNNSGAYWEAGFAEGLGRPVIYLCDKKIFNSKKKKPHFDTNHHTTVIWDVDNMDSSMEGLKATIRSTFPNEAKMDDD